MIKEGGLPGCSGKREGSSTIIVHANVHPIGYIYIRITPNTKCLPKDKMKKGKVKITLTLA